MKVLHTKKALDQALDDDRRKGRKIAFVPTMGALHDAHLQLVKAAQKLADITVVSIFVNPLQFNDKADFDKYPRNVEEDLEKLRKTRVNYVFVPEEKLLYPDSPKSFVTVRGLSDVLEGAFRPGHFEGVTTVVSILFNLVRPQVAIFGEKDFQQVSIIEQMVKDLHFPVEIVRHPIVREKSGLAMSSRNARLSTNGLNAAATISQALLSCVSEAAKGESPDQLKKVFSRIVESESSLKLEHVEVVDETTLQSVDKFKTTARMVTAVWCEGVRLIDNVQLKRS